MYKDHINCWAYFTIQHLNIYAKGRMKMYKVYLNTNTKLKNSLQSEKGKSKPILATKYHEDKLVTCSEVKL